MTRRLNGRVLVVAGSDSSGGAGIQADIKAITAMGAYAATAITALTAQDTQGVYGVFAVTPAFVAQQIRVVLADIGADSIKIGMLHDSPTIEAVADTLVSMAPGVQIILDPVMIAKGGASLLLDDAVATLKRRLLPLTYLITPNVPEAEALLDGRIESVEQQIDAAQALLAMGPVGALVKGGHVEGQTITDVLATAGGTERFQSERIATRHTHGTGCTLASAIAAGLAQGMGLLAAIQRARAYVHAAIATAPGLGQGNGPLNHLASPNPGSL